MLCYGHEADPHRHPAADSRARHGAIHDRDPARARRELSHCAARWTDLADVLRREIAIADTPEAILELQFRLGQLFHDELKDVDAAKCLREGWPKCHGATMSIDKPEERGR